MEIFESQAVDLISPFPAAELPRLASWVHNFGNILVPAGITVTPEMILAYYSQAIVACKSFGVIDKNNALGFQHELPIIGIVLLEPDSPFNTNLHFACNRRAWKSGFMAQAIETATQFTFDQSEALRLSLVTLDTNGPVRSLAKRLGWVFEGVRHSATVYAGVPRDLVYYGIVRPEPVEPAVEPSLEEAVFV